MFITNIYYIKDVFMLKMFYYEIYNLFVFCDFFVCVKETNDCAVQCAVYSVQCAVCSVQCAVCSVQCAGTFQQALRTNTDKLFSIKYYL